MPQGKEDRVGPIVAAFVIGMFIVVITFAIWGPDRDAIRAELREEVHAEYMAEKAIRENDIALENMKWSIKRIDDELEVIRERLDKSWNDFVEGD